MPDKYVLVMADYSSTGIWDYAGDMLAVEDLPVNIELKNRLKKWCDWYETNTDYWHKGDPNRKHFDFVNFSVEGNLIAKDIKHQLLDWKVMYFDEEKYGSTNAIEFYKYEIGVEY